MPEWVRDAGFAGRGGTADDEPLAGLPRVRLQQVHGTRVARAERAGVLPDCDAVRGQSPGPVLTIRTADCLPAALFSPREGYGLVHAGWRGLVGGILEEAVATYRDPGSLVVHLGPAIGVCCFEVGPEVAEHFPGHVRTHPQTGKAHADLFSAARARLVAAGVSASAVSPPGPCTRCHQHLLFSHRGSGGDPRRVTAFVVPHQIV